MVKRKLVIGAALASMIAAGGIIHMPVAHADDTATTEKNSCKGKDKNSCKGKDKQAATATKDKNSCKGKNGCDGKSKDKAAKPADKPADAETAK